MFEEGDVRKHSLDGLSLAAFVSSNSYQEGFDIKKYSFYRISL